MRIFLLSKELLETWVARLIIQVAVFGSSCMHGTCAAIERMSYFWRETWHFSTKILVVTFETLPKIIWQREHNDFPLIYCSVITILQKINHFYHCLNQLLNIWKFITQLNLTIMTILDRCLTPKRSYKNSDAEIDIRTVTIVVDIQQKLLFNSILWRPSNRPKLNWIANCSHDWRKINWKIDPAEITLSSSKTWRVEEMKLWENWEKNEGLLWCFAWGLH